MKYASYLSVAVLISLLISSCSGTKSDESGNSDSLATSANAAEPSDMAVLLWDAGIFETPGKDKKWIASYQFGNLLKLTGEKEENVEEKRVYVEVVGPDDKSGWINEALLAPSSTVGVATGDISLYKNPDVMSISSSNVKPGDILAVSTEEKNGFRQIYGKEKSIKGFINDAGKISADPIDLKVAVFYQKALASKTTEETIKALRAIRDDGSNSSSQFYTLVQNKLSEIDPEAEINDGDGEDAIDSVAAQ